jgi:hypothetical protein
MSAMEFQPGDAEALAKLCAEAREIALGDPCNKAPTQPDPKYSFKFGNWNCSLTLDAWKKPAIWHASVACLQEIGDEPVELSSGMIIRQPVEALVYTSGWTKDERAQAEFLLGELMAPFILGEHQEVHVTTGMFALHYLTKVEN